jgi:hypothetical protein
MPASASVWIALVSVILALLVQLIVFVRHITKMEGSIAGVAKDVGAIEQVEDKLETSKVVMLRPHHRGPE